MDNTNNLNKKEQIITEFIIKKGGNKDIAKSLIRNNPTLLSFDNDDFKRHIFLVMNSDVVYAILFIIENDLFWTVLNGYECGPLIKSNGVSIDYVIYLMLESVSKFNHLKSIKENTTLEDKINKYSLVKKNESGYHIK